MLLVATVSWGRFDRRLFSCHGVVRLGLPDGLVFWFCHGDERSVFRRFKDGYMVRCIVGYMVWYLVGV